MAAIATQSVEKDGPLVRLFGRTIGHRLPRKYKRMIYISSILGLLQQVREPDMELVKKLNDIIKIAHHVEVIQGPIYIKNLIWRTFSKRTLALSETKTIAVCDIAKSELTQRECEVIGNFFANSAPEWMRYGSLGMMINDVTLLIQNLKRFSGGQDLTPA